VERQFFDWTEWDDLGDYMLQFYDPVLKVDLGEFKAGQKFNTATVNFQNGEMEFYNDNDDVIATFQLTFNATQLTS
jgi:hypothetical protein